MPATVKRDGTEARVHCTSNCGCNCNIEAPNLNASFNKSLETVQKLDGSGNDDGPKS